LNNLWAGLISQLYIGYSASCLIILGTQPKIHFETEKSKNWQDGSLSATAFLQTSK